MHSGFKTRWPQEGVRCLRMMNSILLMDWLIGQQPLWASVLSEQGRDTHNKEGPTNVTNMSLIFSVTKVWLLSVTKHISTLISRMLTTSGGGVFTFLWIPGGTCWVRNQVNISAVILIMYCPFPQWMSVLKCLIRKCLLSLSLIFVSYQWHINKSSV